MNMPPHHDTRNGPVLKAAEMALETGNVNYVLIWVPEASEKKLKNLFEKMYCERRAGKDVQDIAINWYFETVERIHRAGERTLYTCMKPAGLDESPVVPKAERAIETGDAEELIGVVPKTMEGELRQHFHYVVEKRNYDVNNIIAGRAYVAAFIDFIVYLHNLNTITSGEVGHAEQKKKDHDGNITNYFL
jgi:HEPN domain-containing protein